jgi:hypothetical protein
LKWVPLDLKLQDFPINVIFEPAKQNVNRLNPLKNNNFTPKRKPKIMKTSKKLFPLPIGACLVIAMAFLTGSASAQSQLPVDPVNAAPGIHPEHLREVVPVISQRPRAGQGRASGMKCPRMSDLAPSQDFHDITLA